jgi:phage shock protein A
MAITLAEVWQEMSNLVARAERAEDRAERAEARVAELEARVAELTRTDDAPAGTGAPPPLDT